MTLTTTVRVALDDAWIKKQIDKGRRLVDIVDEFERGVDGGVRSKEGVIAVIVGPTEPGY